MPRVCCVLLFASAFAGCTAGEPAPEPAAPSQPPEGDPALATGEAQWTVLLDGTSLDRWEVTSFGGEGEVELVDGTVRMGMGSMLTGIHYPHADELPRTDYELEVVAARLAGTDFFCGLTFPVGDSHATLVLGGWGGALTGLSCLDGLDASDNETRSYRSYAKGRDYTARVRVTAERIRAWVDGESVVDAPIAGRKVGLRAEVLKSRPLGVACYATVARVRSVRIRELEE